MMSSTYRTFQAVYAFVKQILGIPRQKTNAPLKFLLVILTSMVILLFGVLLAISGTFYVGLKRYLKWQHGENFAGMMTGQDCVWKDVYVQIFVTVSTESWEETLSTMRAAVENISGSCNKFRFLMRSRFGYSYYIKNDRFQLDDYILKIQRDEGFVWSKRTLLDYIEANLIKSGVTKDRTWCLTIFKQPLRLGDGTYKYASVLTVNHCVSDGIGLVSLFKNKISKNFDYLNLSSEFVPSETKLKPLDDAYVCPIPPRTAPEKESDEPLLTFFVENEEKYVPMTKEVKSKLNASFSGVLLAAFAIAYVEYAEKINPRLSELNISHVFRIPDLDTAKMFRGDYDFNNISNTSLLGTMKLENNTGRNPMETFLNVDRKLREYMGSGNLLLTKLIGGILHLLPPTIEKMLFTKLSMGSDIGMTNITGLVSAGIGDHQFENMSVTVTPHYIIDIVFCVLTYKGKFHISVLSAKHLVDKRTDLEDIIKRAFEHIELLNKNLRVT